MMNKKQVWVTALLCLGLGVLIGYMWGEAAERNRILTMQGKFLQKDIDEFRQDVRGRTDSLIRAHPEIFDKK